MSRFVSAGTDAEPTETDEAWLKAQQDVEAKRREKAAAGRPEDAKSLYETLQANKAAKQEAFEESARLKNQFRSLDDDEVEFLDSVLESTRAKEEEVRKETTQQLDAFRRQQDEAAKVTPQEDATEHIEVESWKSGPRKRKKGREPAIGSIKLRRTSTVEAKRGEQDKADDPSTDAGAATESSPTREIETSGPSAQPTSAPHGGTERKSSVAPSPKASPPSQGALGLAAYTSSEED